MRLKFRNVGQANRYWKICRDILNESCEIPEGAWLGRERLRNAIYRAFGFNSFPDFQKNFVPDNRVKAWFHSEEELESVFSRGLADAIADGRERGVECPSSTELLVKKAVEAAFEANDSVLRRLISR
jgi:hypothetical protein